VYKEGILEEFERDRLFSYECEMLKKIKVACMLNLALCCKGEWE